MRLLERTHDVPAGFSPRAGDGRESKAEAMMSFMIQFWESQIILSAYSTGHVGQSWYSVGGDYTTT